MSAGVTARAPPAPCLDHRPSITKGKPMADENNDDEQETWDAVYGTPPAPEYSSEEEETYRALFGPAEPDPLTPDEQQLYDHLYPEN